MESFFLLTRLRRSGSELRRNPLIGKTGRCGRPPDAGLSAGRISREIRANLGNRFRSPVNTIRNKASALRSTAEDRDKDCEFVCNGSEGLLQAAYASRISGGQNLRAGSTSSRRSAKPEEPLQHTRRLPASAAFAVTCAPCYPVCNQR